MMTTRIRFGFALSVLLLVSGISAAESVVYPNAEATKPLQAGASVPSACVQTVEGESLDLASTLRGTGALLVFYRGGW